jgi:hypothetical protein
VGLSEIGEFKKSWVGMVLLQCTLEPGNNFQPAILGCKCALRKWLTVSVCKRLLVT